LLLETKKTCMLDVLITSKTRLRLLVRFFISASNQGHLRGLAEEFNESTNAIRKELNHLSEAGYLKKEAVQNRIRYQANSEHPLFSSLQRIVRQYVGLDVLVETVIGALGDVRKILVVGDYAKGIDSGTIEIVLLGENLDTDYVALLTDKLTSLLSRKVQMVCSDENLHEGLVLFEKEVLSSV
jgi:hypothetical protein